MSFKHSIKSQGRQRHKQGSFKTWLQAGSVLLAFSVAGQVQGQGQRQISQSISYSYNTSKYDNSVNLNHSLRGLELRIFDFSLNQSTSYSLDTGRFGDYQAGLDINDDQNLFGNINGSLGAQRRSVAAFADNRFARDHYEFGLSGNGNVDWRKSTFGDEGFLDPDFNFLDYTEEELDATVWVPSHFVEANATLEVNQFSIGRLKVRPRLDGAVGHSDFGGLSYGIAGASGFSIAPKDEDSGFSFFFEESNLSADVPGGNYGAGDGELVLAAGYDAQGVAKLAALVFKRFEPSDKVEFSFDSSGSLAYNVEEGIGFDAGAVRLGAGFRPTDNWNIDNSLTVNFSRDFIPSYSFDTSLNFSRFANFRPYVRASAYYSDGAGNISLPVGFNATVYEKLRLSAELSPSYATFDQSYDLDASGRITLLGPPLLENGSDSQFSLSANTSLLTGDTRVSVGGTLNF